MKLIRQELQEVSSLEDKSTLLAISDWVPYASRAEYEVRKMGADSEEERKLLGGVERIRRDYSIRIDCDYEWEASQAPGFILFSESELLTQRSHLEAEVPEVASMLLNRWGDESQEDLPIKEPILVTLLFELAAKDKYEYYNVWLINVLLRELERLEVFQPDLRGLFEEYLVRCINYEARLQ